MPWFAAAAPLLEGAGGAALAEGGAVAGGTAAAEGGAGGAGGMLSKLGKMPGAGGMMKGGPMGQMGDVKKEVGRALAGGQMAEQRVANVAAYLNPSQFG